jgi:hypothetical protein
MARRKGCLASLFFIAILIVAALLVMPVVPLGWLKPRVESRLSATLGRAVTVDSLRMTLLGRPHLTITGLTAKEDPAFGDGNFLKANEVRADFSLLDYVLHRQLIIHTISIHSPDFSFVKNPNGAWSWTTLGPKKLPANAPETNTAVALPQMMNDPLALLIAVAPSQLHHIDIDAANVRLVDKTGAQPPESLYKNVALTSDLDAGKDNPLSEHTTGTLHVASNESDDAEPMTADMPFEFTITPSEDAGTRIKGNLGPGAFATKNFSATLFKIDGDFISAHGAGLSGSGHISGSAIQIANLNISRQVADAARVNEIGDMKPGTAISQLETDFNYAEDVVNTTNLKLVALDNLGDANAETGWFKMKPELTLNYEATITLSPEATAQLKTSANPLIPPAVALLAGNNGLSLPLQITGDVGHPQIQVDIVKAIGLK